MKPCKFLLAFSFVFALIGRSWAADDPAVLQIGMVDSLVVDLSPGKRKLLADDFPDLVREFTGLKSELHQGGAPALAAKKLAAGDWHFAVFHGVEFAWVAAKDPKLAPLTVAVGKERAIHALLVVNKDDAATAFADLKGKNIALHVGRAHTRLFLDKNAAGLGEKFFGKVTPTMNSEEALDNILRGKVQGAIIDNGALAIYESINPGRFQRLKVIAKSERFPGTVIGYHEGALGKTTLAKVRDGLLKVHQSERGRDALANFRVTHWEAPPDDYGRQLSEILKAYPSRSE